MPVVRKRPRENGSKTNEQVKRRKTSKEYTEFENIGYQDDHWHSTFRSLPDNVVQVTGVLSKYIGSFLNGDGGILCFGVRKTGVIYGEKISRREEDNLKLIIDEIFKKMTPHVQTDAYRVTFTPVVGSSFRRRDGVKEATTSQVLEIRVAPGDPFSLYEDHNHEVFLRKGNQPYGPLTPHEIKRHTVQQLTRQLKSHKGFAKLFEKPETSKEKNKENRIDAKNKSSSGGLSPTKKPSFKSNQSSSSKNSKSSVKVSPAKSSRYTLRSSSQSKTELSSKLASCKPQPSKAKAVQGSKEHLIVLSSGESDHEAPLPSMQSRLKPSESKKNAVESVQKPSESKKNTVISVPSVQKKPSESKKIAVESVEKPQATKLQIKPFQIKKKVPEPTITEVKCQGKQQDKDKVVPTQEKAAPPPIIKKQPTKQTSKLSSLLNINPTSTTQKQSSSKLPTKPVSKPAIAPAKRPSTIPPPPPRPPSFSHSTHLHAQAQPHYYHDHSSHPYPYHSYARETACSYSRYGYPIRGSSVPSYQYQAHPLATSYSAPYYKPYH